jgi:mannose-6-phosphate isomerase-like protein (cupin superfamily)
MADNEIRVFAPVADYILHARYTPVQTVYSWERNGAFLSLYPDQPDQEKPPYDATEIFVRLYAFPGAMVREIYLDARSRTHHHVSNEDILFYQVSGRRVQIVNERSREVNPGDASLQISGVWKRVDQIIPGVFVEFSMQRPAKAGAEATWIAANEALTQPMAEWSRDGKSYVFQGVAAGAAPTFASRYEIKTFMMQGYKLHEVRLPKGATVGPRTYSVDTVFYVVRGRMKAEIGEVNDEVEARDAMRAPGGVGQAFEALEDTVFLYAAIPPERPDAD